MADSFTPGPWIAVAFEDGFDVYGANSEPVAVSAHEGAAVISEADARLIAAAPDLLAVCRELFELLDRDGYAPDYYRRAEAAIAKALGRP